MTHLPFTLSAPRLFDGTNWHEETALVIKDGRVTALSPIQTLAPEMAHQRLRRGFLAPGFVDLQVNGGGGVMLNAQPTTQTITTMISAHARFGTTAMLPTLITDTDAVRQKAITAAITAAKAGLSGFAGLHLEGPFLSPARKGTHNPKLMRAMNEHDVDALIAARQSLPALMLTLAPEQVPLGLVERLSAAGITVSLGHTDATADAVSRYADAGARLVTHLFNAQSQMLARAPGVVGATLFDGRLSAGLIADGIHVDPRAMSIALRAKKGPGRLFLVTDAMAATGSDLDRFTLNERTIFRRNGRLTTEDGTLAGADLDMASAVRNIVGLTDIGLSEALRMASLYPAQAMGFADRGGLQPGFRADLVWLDADLDVQGVWMEGAYVGDTPNQT